MTDERTERERLDAAQVFVDFAKFWDQVQRANSRNTNGILGATLIDYAPWLERMRAALLTERTEPDELTLRAENAEAAVAAVRDAIDGYPATERTGERERQYKLTCGHCGHTRARHPGDHDFVPVPAPEPERGEGALRPCPFCGSAAVLSPASDTDPTPTVPGCPACDVWCDDVAAWNRRAAEPEPADRIREDWPLFFWLDGDAPDGSSWSPPSDEREVTVTVAQLRGLVTDAMEVRAPEPAEGREPMFGGGSMEDRLRDLLNHAWVHSGYSRCGYQKMTSQQRALFDVVVGDPAPAEVLVTAEYAAERKRLAAPPAPAEPDAIRAAARAAWTAFVSEYPEVAEDEDCTDPLDIAMQSLAAALESTPPAPAGEPKWPPTVRYVSPHWFALPSGPGSDVGPFSTAVEAWEWIEAVAPQDATGEDES